MLILIIFTRERFESCVMLRILMYRASRFVKRCDLSAVWRNKAYITIDSQKMGISPPKTLCTDLHQICHSASPRGFDHRW